MKEDLRMMPYPKEVERNIRMIDYYLEIARENHLPKRMIRLPHELEAAVPHLGVPPFPMIRSPTKSDITLLYMHHTDDGAMVRIYFTVRWNKMVSYRWDCMDSNSRITAVVRCPFIFEFSPRMIKILVWFQLSSLNIIKVDDTREVKACVIEGIRYYPDPFNTHSVIIFVFAA